MPDFRLTRQPQYPIQTLDTDSPITPDQIRGLWNASPAVTLCVRSATGHKDRGGSFFCLRRQPDADAVSLETMEGIAVDSFSLEDLTRFINHAAGLKFDPEMLAYCQNSVNFRAD